MSSVVVYDDSPKVKRLSVAACLNAIFRVVVAANEPWDTTPKFKSTRIRRRVGAGNTARQARWERRR